MLKFKKSAAALVISSFLFALIGGGKLPYFLFYVALFTVGVSFLWTKATVNMLGITQRIVKEYAYVGDEIEIKTMVFNGSILPVPFVEVKNEMVKDITGSMPSSNIVSLLPFDSRSVLEKIKCKYRGYYLLGPVNIRVSDIFGMFTWNRKVMCEGSLAVYPRVAQLGNFSTRPMQMFGTTTTKKKANEDYSSISDIRKYYPGDSIKRIHWKVSARKGALFVKNYEMSGSAEAYIFLNLFNNDYNNLCRPDVEEKAVECTASIIHYMLRKNINTGLYTNGSKVVYTRGRDLKEFIKFMRELITVKSDGSNPMEELLKSRSRLIPRGSSVILITPGLNESLLDKVIQLIETGLDVIIVYIMVEDSNEHLKSIYYYTGKYNIKLYKVRINDDVKSSLEG